MVNEHEKILMRRRVEKKNEYDLMKRGDDDWRFIYVFEDYPRSKK